MITADSERNVLKKSAVDLSGNEVILMTSHDRS